MNESSKPLKRPVVVSIVNRSGRAAESIRLRPFEHRKLAAPR